MSVLRTSHRATQVLHPPTSKYIERYMSYSIEMIQRLRRSIYPIGDHEWYDAHSDGWCQKYKRTSDLRSKKKRERCQQEALDLRI